MTTLHPTALPALDDARAAWGACCAPGSATACSPGQRLPWFRLILGLFVAGQTMLLGLAINLTPPDSTTARLILQGGMLLAVLVVAGLLGTPLARDAWHALRRRRVTMEMLFLVALGGALTYSCVSMARGRGAVYFEVVAVVLIVYSLGRAVSALSRRRALASVAELTAPLAHVKLLRPPLPSGERAGVRGRAAGDVGSSDVEYDLASADLVPVTTIAPGDLVQLDPGDSAPIDGVIVRGSAFVREPHFTGEWAPQVRGPGDRIDSGAATLDGTLVVRATSRGADRRIDRLVSAIEQARSQPTSLQRRADRFVAWFLPIVLTVAVGTFVGWTLAAGVDRGLTTAMAVLLVACPCAAGLATPLVLWTVLGKLARQGLVLRGGDALERLATIDAAIFDKTGTLGHADLALHALDLHGPPDTHARTRALIAAVEARCDHPVAQALRGVAPATDPLLAAINVGSLRILPGKGVEAVAVLLPPPLPPGESRGEGELQPAPPAGTGNTPTHHPHPGEGRRAAAFTLPPLPPGEGRGEGELQAAPPAGTGDTDAPPCSPSPGVADDATLSRRERGQRHVIRLVRGHCNTPDLRRVEVFIDDTHAATATLGEKLRGDAAAALAALRELGVAVRVMTGDTAAGAARVAALAPVDAQLTPEDKRRRVAQLRGEDAHAARPLFVGDGLNDAAAMAAAHVSIALAGGAAVTVEAADATLHGGDLLRVPQAVALARRAVAVVDAHLRWAVLFNLVGIAVAAAGWLHPIFAALLMAGSSALVASRSLRVAAGIDRAPARRREERAKSRRFVGEEHRAGVLRAFAALHAAGLVGQGAVLAGVIGLGGYAAGLTVAAFACAAGWLLLVWPRLPGWADMTLAMVTLGGLGMNLGWWADLGFTAAGHGAGGCCAAALSQSPLHLVSWMNGGMLLLGVPAMFAVRRRPEPFDLRRWCCTGMLVLGVPGMVVGMVAGSVLAGALTRGWPTEAAVLADYAAMMAGMCLGMLVPHALHRGDAA